MPGPERGQGLRENSGNTPRTHGGLPAARTQGSVAPWAVNSHAEKRSSRAGAGIWLWRQKRLSLAVYSRQPRGSRLWSRDGGGQGATGVL